MKYFRYGTGGSCLLWGAFAIAQPSAPPRKLVAEFRINGVQEELTRIHGILPQATGDVVVLLEDAMFGRLYSDRGILKKKFLRSGGGPGEARSAVFSGMIADTVWVYDDELRRYTLLKNDGSLLRSWVARPLSAWQNGSLERRLLGTAQPVALLPKNVCILQISAPASYVASGEVMTRPIVRSNWESVVSGVIDLQRRAVPIMELRVGGGRSYGWPQKFAPDPLFGVTPDGSRLVLVEMNTSRNEAFFYVTQVSINGDTLRRTKVPFIRDPVTPRTIDSVVRAVTAKRPENAAAYRAALYLAPHWPAVLNVLVANDGTTWLQMHSTNAFKRWIVLSPAGIVTMSIDVPNNIRLLRIDRGIWGTELDEDDVPSVVRYKIGR